MGKGGGNGGEGGGEGGRVIRWKGGKFLILFKDVGRRVSQRFHCFF